MRAAVFGVVSALLAPAAGAQAATALDIRQAAAEITVIPEARGDVSATLVRADRRLPLRMFVQGDTLVIDGGLGDRVMHCGANGVDVFGIGHVARADLPRVVAHVPLDMRLAASGGVYGAAGRARSASLDASGCGAWTLADVSQGLALHLSGSADVRAGASGSAEVHVSGSGDAHLRQVAGAAVLATSGSGDVAVARVDGSLDAHTSGSGNIEVHGGHVGAMRAHVSGSGAVTFRGVASSLQAEVSGSGDVEVARVTGPVVKRVTGSGDVTVGH